MISLILLKDDQITITNLVLLKEILLYKKHIFFNKM